MAGTYFQNDDAGIAKAIEQGLQHELVVVGDAVVGQVLLALLGDRLLPLHVVQVLDALRREVGGDSAGCLIRRRSILGDEERELFPAIE